MNELIKLKTACAKEPVLVFSLVTLNSCNCRIYMCLCPLTSERESEQREKWMLGKRLAGAGSRRASSGSAGNMVTICHQTGFPVWRRGSRTQHLYHSPLWRRATVTIAMVSNILGVFLGICCTHECPYINMLHT